MSRIDEYLINCCEGCGCDGLPEPISTTDKLLYHLAEKLANIGGGGGAQSDWNAAAGAAGHVLNRTHYKEEQDTELASGNYTSALIPDYGVFGCPVAYHTRWEAPRPEEFIISFDGVEYRGLNPSTVVGLGTLAGNFAMLNAIMGTSFANTGEPFLAYVGETSNAIVFTMDTAPTDHEIKISYFNVAIKKLDRDFLSEPQKINFIELGLPAIPSDGTKVSVEFDMVNAHLLDFCYSLLNDVVRVVFNRKDERDNAGYSTDAIAIASQYFSTYYLSCFVAGIQYVIEVHNYSNEEGKQLHIDGYAKV